MRAVAIASPGGPEVLEEREVEDPPPPGDGEVLLRVAAAGVNRTDTVQRQGGYPPAARRLAVPGGRVLRLHPRPRGQRPPALGRRRPGVRAA